MSKAIPSDGKIATILHLVAGAKYGGAETFCLDAIEALAEVGLTQHVICRPHAHLVQRLTQLGIAFDTLSFSRSDRFGKAAELIRRRVHEFRPDLIHAWMGRAASFVPAGLKIPVLGWFGGYYDLKRYRRCDFYMGVTKDIVRHIIEQSGRPHRTFLGHTFGTLEPQPPADRKAIHTPVDAPVVLLLSRMHPKKGIDTLLYAAQKVPNAWFWLAGDGPDKQKYETLALKLGLTEKVRFLGWRHDRAALLAAADICVLPSPYEPFGTVIAESCAQEYLWWQRERLGRGTM